MTDTPASRRASAGLQFLLVVLVVFVAAPATCQEAHAAGTAGNNTAGNNAAEETAGDKTTHGAEPSTWLLLGTGLGIILLFHHQRRRDRQAPRPHSMTSGRPRAPATSS